MCRGSYVDPRAIDLFRQGVTVERAVARVTRTGNVGTPASDELTAAQLPTIAAAPTVERAVLKMLAQ